MVASAGKAKDLKGIRLGGIVVLAHKYGCIPRPRLLQRLNRQSSDTSKIYTSNHCSALELRYKQVSMEKEKLAMDVSRSESNTES